ncbi:MAG: hypothetical protein ABH816_01295 [Candidatus Levyibacteriota bacterium]
MPPTEAASPAAQPDILKEADAILAKEQLDQLAKHEEPEVEEKPNQEPEEPANEIETSKFRADARRETIEELDEDLIKGVADRMLNRRDSALRRRETHGTLEKIDGALLSLSESQGEQIKNGEFDNNTLKLAYSAMFIEKFQRSIAYGKFLRETTTAGRLQRLKNFPFLNRLAQDPQLQTHLEEAGIKLNTPYMQEIIAKNYDPQDAENNLRELHKLTHGLEQRLFGQTFDDPFLDRVSTSLYPFDLTKGGHNIYHNEVLKSLLGENGKGGILERRYGGKDITTLLAENPLEACRAINEAINEGTMTFSQDLGKKLLESDKPTRDLNPSLIDNKITELKDEKAHNERVTKLTEDQTKADSEFGTAKTTFDTLKQDLQTAEKDLPKAEEDLELAEARKTDFQPELAKRLDEWKQELKASQGRRTPKLSKNKDNEAMIAGMETSRSEEIQSFVKEISALEAKIENIDEELLKAKLKVKHLKGVIAKLDGAMPGTGTIKTADDELETKKVAKKAADEALVKENKDWIDGSEQVKGLNAWKDTGTNSYDTIIGENFKVQKPEDMFSIENLTSAEELPNGEIVGTERMRLLLFGNKDPELYRKILSDETIARAIIRIYKIDPESVDEIGVSLNEKLKNIQELKKIIDRTPDSDPDKVMLKEGLRAQRRTLMKTVLPQVNESRQKMGDLQRFILHQGLISAINGDAFLELSDEKTFSENEMQPQFERQSAAAISREGAGNAEIDGHNRRVTWDGEIINSELARILQPTIAGMPGEQPLHYRVVNESPNRAGIKTSLQLEVNDTLKSMLPETFTQLQAAIPLSSNSLKDFYDPGGHLRTDLQGENFIRYIKERRLRGLPQWVTLSDSTTNDADTMLNFLMFSVSQEASVAMPVSVADTFMQQSPAERQRTVTGLQPITINDGTVDRAIQYKDGNLTITNQTTGKSMELGAFYEAFLKDQKENVFNVQNLDAAQRTQVRDSLIIFQEQLGREIMRSLQRR